MSPIFRLVLLPAVALFIGAIVLSGCRDISSSSPLCVKASFGDFDLKVKASGHLQPVSEKVAAVPAQLWGTLEYIVEEGSVVSPGDVLFRVSTQNAARSARNFRLDARRRKITYMQTKIENKQAAAERAEELSIKNARLAEAREQEAILRKGADPLALKKQLISAKSAELSIKHLKARLKRKKLLAERGYASRLELLQTEDEYQQALLKRRKAENLYRKLSEGCGKLELKKVSFENDRVREDLEDFRESSDRQAKIDALELEKTGVNVKSAEAAAKQREDVIARATVTATTTGTAILLSSPWSEAGRPCVGMSVWGDMRLVKVADLTRMKAVVMVAEQDIEKVSKGQKAEVVLPALFGSGTSGIVTRVGKIAVKAKERNIGPGSQQKRFEVWIELSTSDERFRPNITVDVSVITSRLRSVWRVPVPWLGNHGDGAWVNLVQNDGSKPVRVQVQVLGRDRDFCYVKGKLPRNCFITLPDGESG